VHTILNWGSTLADFASGALWLYASQIPRRFALIDLSALLRKQARYNSYAAAATALATILQAGTLGTG